MRRLLICSSPKSDIGRLLKRRYLKRVQEMFKRAITMESTFNFFYEVYHGIAQTSLIKENLHSFYESFLTITQYYQASQAGQGSLVAKLIEKLGTSEKIKSEFFLTKLPQFLGQNVKLEENSLTKQKFDIANKNGDNLALCELKMKVYSGCSAGRIELMGKFNKFVTLITQNERFRKILRDGGIRNIYLIGGVLFDIEGEPATTKKDEEWGICFNGLIRAKNDILRTLSNMSLKYNIDEEKLPEKAFIIDFLIDGINVKIVAVYGNEVVQRLFIGKQKHDISYFKQQLEGMLYDDMWLGQIISLSERTILAQNFKKNKKLINFITAIMGDDLIISEIEKLRISRNENILEEVTLKTIESLRVSNKELLEIKQIPAALIMKYSFGEYSLGDYIADIVQFLSCENLMKSLR